MRSATINLSPALELGLIEMTVSDKPQQQAAVSGCKTK